MGPPSPQDCSELSGFSKLGVIFVYLPEIPELELRLESLHLPNLETSWHYTFLFSYSINCFPFRNPLDLYCLPCGAPLSDSLQIISGDLPEVNMDNVLLRRQSQQKAMYFEIL
jgi:hypothetical protein